MSQFAKSVIGEEAQGTVCDFVEEIRAKYPHRKSLCGALLAEVLRGETLESRSRAASVMPAVHCRRGFKVLRSIVEKYRVEYGKDRGPSLVAEVLIAIGATDTSEGHSYLVSLLGPDSPSLLRADVLEGLAFEKKKFDLGVIFPFLSLEVSEAEELSALYCVFCNCGYSQDEIERVNQSVVLLLDHPSCHIRAFATQALQISLENRQLVESMRSDPSEMVWHAVDSVLAYWNSQPLDGR